MIVTDTASYSDIFGLLTLAGFAYAPQLADLPVMPYGRRQEAPMTETTTTRIVRCPHRS